MCHSVKDVDSIPHESMVKSLIACYYSHIPSFGELWQPQDGYNILKKLAVVLVGNKMNIEFSSAGHAKRTKT